ncbi:xylulokinase [Yonghaparkia sp. Root332]|uniref:xylulokinase n=1 Tax=Yonghaparkia sp. Root332 TaxID=1736516 RepID=UPI0006FA6E82|nr:xylulokinase [Yonghaparkia sp. Root332]KQV24589.1 xylulose kinase [Yonghaparkia sp. Root332]
MTLVAGVDSSTQSCKVVVVDAETGAIVREGRAPHPDGTSVDPTAWWDALFAAIADAGGLDDVAAIAVAGQQHGMVALDADGRVVRDALLWNDTRSAAAAAALIDEVGAEEYARRAGSVPVASFTATKLRWLRDHEPDSAGRVAAVCLPHDWLTWRLRGFGPAGESTHGPKLAELTTDRSDASGTAYWSPSTGHYDLELLERALGRRVRLPRVLGPLERAGVTGARGIPLGIPIGSGAGDNAAAALGLGASAGDVVISIGTSGTVFAVASEPVLDASGTVAGFASADGAFLPLVATLNAARVLDAVARLLGVDHDGLAELALAASPGADGVVLLPYFEGERTPNLPDATASLSGLTLASTTRENLARAAIEGMLCGLADGLDAIVRHGLEPRRLLLVGGAARSAAVPAIASEVLGLPVDVPDPGEYVARGAARQAAGMLAGALPEWPLTVHASVEHPPQPHVRAAYMSAYQRHTR